jgi:hypothetical protein
MAADKTTSPPLDSLARPGCASVTQVRPIELFDAWMFAEADAALALATWRSAPRAEKRNAHAAYVAALDRETHAADVLQRRVRGFRSR